MLVLKSNFHFLSERHFYFVITDPRKKEESKNIFYLIWIQRWKSPETEAESHNVNKRPAQLRSWEWALPTSLCVLDIPLRTWTPGSLPRRRILTVALFSEAPKGQTVVCSYNALRDKILKLTQVIYRHRQHLWESGVVNWEENRWVLGHEWCFSLWHGCRSC